MRRWNSLPAGAVLIALTTTRPGAPATGGPEAGSARDMSTHHALTGHDRVRRLARAMVDGRRSEIDRMNAMLRERGAPAA